MQKLSNYNSVFQQELSKLNPAQKEAVNHLEGPVLVIAGPGTGKTQILSARIGKILSSPDTQAAPHNILCLTYTDAGTIAMRKRLLKFIGPDAYRVHIYTFHAFCNQVIQDNLDYFGYRELQPVSDLECVNLFQKLVDSFHSKHPLKRFGADAYYEVGRLKSLFDLMKRECWTPEFISKKIDEYISDLPHREEYIYKRANSVKGIKAGDINEGKLAAEKEKLELLRAAAMEFPKYQEMMKEAKRYDYNDMILWVLDAFKNNQNLLLRYQERYLYFLVDEYQDTNGSQNEILNRLTSYWEEPNIFVVGDDDQSIYRFQGANVKNIVDFYDRYQKSVKTIVMTENYRSTQTILDSAKAVIDNNKERLVNKLNGLSKELVAKGTIASSNVQPQIIEYYNSLHEEAGIVKEIEKLYHEGEDLSEVAVIYRNHKLVANIVKALELKNIPLNVKQKVNILELPFIQNVVNILTYIQKEYEKPHSAEYLLYEIMHYAFFDISSRDAALLCKTCWKAEERFSWRELIASKERLFQLNLESAKAISQLEENLSYWIKEVSNLTVQGLFEKMLTKGGIVSWIMKSPDNVWLMQVITSLFDFIKEETAKNPRLKLKDILKILDQMRSNGISLDLNKIVHAEKGVNFVTSHSSKGLEFKHVFLISSTAKCWEKQANRNFGYKLPDTISESDLEEDQPEEERRLFYVALTRAKEHLYISYAAKEKNGKEQEMSQYVAEILDKNNIAIEKRSLEESEVIQFQAELMLGNENPKVELIDREFLKDALKNYKMSVTHLNKYLKCPLTFYFENVIKVPTARSESMGFGNAIHYALFSLFMHMSRSKEKKFPDKEIFYSFFLEGLKNHQSHFTDKEFERRQDYGKELLPELYDYYHDKWHKFVVVEYRVNNAEMDGIPITGALDKMEFDGNKVNVVDYKTGSPENGKKKLNKPDEKDPLGGDYWRQIVFYKILLDCDRTKNHEMISGEIDFVQKNNKKEFSKHKIFVTPEDVKLVREQIKSTYKNIMNFEFQQGCGEEDCQWCNFVKYNFKSDKLDLAKVEED
ncbi:MAG: ATP-dependent helicase [Cytophagaceae bacterium]|nr:ATP-dependent helicase [Cytophagaceae bacterium]